MATNKNTMLPTYSATYKNMLKALGNGDISTACWVYLSDRECLCFVDSKLVPHVMLWDSVETLKNQVEDIQKNGATILITTDGGDE